MKTKTILFITLLALLLAACQTQSPTATPPPTPSPQPPATSPVAPTTNLTTGCITDYQENVDYFPQKTAVQYATGFTIEYFPHYKLVTVNNPWADAAAPIQYLLVPCGAPVPDGYGDAIVIETPIQSLVTMSTTYLPYLVEFGLLDALVGVDNGQFATTTAVAEKFNAGELVEIGSDSSVNVEQAIALDPDLIMTYASGFPEYDAHPKLEEAGLQVALNADFLETNPLGRAEWGKFIATFFNAEATADAWFNEVAAEYNTLTALADTAATNPTVLTQTPYEGTWYVPGGQSFAANLLSAAGASYPWADDPTTGSLYLDFETVYDQAANADFWLDVGFFGSLADLQAADERYADFAAFQNGRVYNNDNIIGPNGGIDYYESGAANPHIVLADLIKILHPELLPDHELVYYRLMD